MAGRVSLVALNLQALQLKMAARQGGAAAGLLTERVNGGEDGEGPVEHPTARAPPRRFQARAAAFPERVGGDLEGRRLRRPWPDQTAEATGGRRDDDVRRRVRGVAADWDLRTAGARGVCRRDRRAAVVVDVRADPRVVVHRHEVAVPHHRERGLRRQEREGKAGCVGLLSLDRHGRLPPEAKRAGRHGALNGHAFPVQRRGLEAVRWGAPREERALRELVAGDGATVARPRRRKAAADLEVARIWSEGFPSSARLVAEGARVNGSLAFKGTRPGLSAQGLRSARF